MSESSPTTGLKLNLGSGQNPKAGYINVDRFGSPDVKWDLEAFPWPWPDDSVEEVQMVHVLEHLGDTTEVFFGVLKELYRVCRHEAKIRIIVPHARHDDFLNDPTHVRAFMPESFHFYSKERNLAWKELGFSNTPLALYLDIDLVVTAMRLDLAPPYAGDFEAGKLTQTEVTELARSRNNVIKQIQVLWTVKKMKG